MKKMNHLRKVLTLFLSIVLVNIGQSQNCYEVIADMSGFDTSPYQAELQSAACELKNAFPVEFQDQFKVYDFGFYSMNEYMQGGFQAVWDKVVSEIPTDYYLIFGKQTDRTGIYTKFWVALKLPSDGNFSCFSEQQFTLLENSIGVKTNSHYSSLGKSPFQYAQAEVFSMNSLKYQVESMIQCCDPSLRSSCSLCPTPEEIRDFFSTKNYHAIPISIDSEGLPTLFRQRGSEKRSTTTNFSYSDITLHNEQFNIGEVLENEVNIALNEGINASGFCTSNIDFCDDNIAAQLLNEFDYQNFAASINSHIWENPDTTKADTLFIKFYNDPSKFTFTLPSVTISTPYWECGPKPLPDVNSGQNYAITESNGTYYGYHLNNGQWTQSDSVQYISGRTFGTIEKENTWADQGASRQGLSFKPSFKAWLHANTPSVFTTVSEDSEFKTAFKLLHIESALGDYEDVFDDIYHQFKYAGFNPPSNQSSGTSLNWNCDSKFGKGIAELEAVVNEVDSLKDLVNNRLSIHHDLDDLFTINKFLLEDFVDNPNLSGLPMWAFATIGGSQGIKVQIKSIKKLNSPCSNSNHANKYEVEALFTLIDNFGVGMSDGAKWWFPGLVEQWVLQHYRNYDCGSSPCYIPITNHTVQTFHKFQLCF